MACGTGKTFTALKIAEKMAPTGHVLFLVPSLSLMSQSLREWTAEWPNQTDVMPTFSVKPIQAQTPP
jgi:predicted helicase